MELTVKERIILQQVLPKAGKDYVTLALAEQLMKKLVFTEAEIEEIELKANDAGGLAWKASAPDFTIPMGVKTVEIVKKALLEMEKADPPKLTVDHLSLYRKFVGTPAVED